MNNNVQQFQNKQFQQQINAINDEYQQKMNDLFQNWKQKPIIIYDDDDVKQEQNKIEQFEIERKNQAEIVEFKVDEKQENKTQTHKERIKKENSIQIKDQKRKSKIQRFQQLYNEDELQLDNQRIPKKTIKCGNQPFFIYLSIRSKQLNKVQYKELLQICKREWSIMDITEKQIYKLMFLEKKLLKSDKETIKESEASKHQGESIE